MAKAKKSAGRNANGMGSIYPDGDGYRVAIQVGHDPASGKPRYRKARAKSHEEAVATLKRLQMEEGMGRLGAASGSTVAEYLARWLDAHVKPPMRAPSTYRQYEWLVRDHINPHLGKKRLDKVSRTDVQKLVSMKATQKVSARDKEGKSVREETLSRNTLRLIKAVLSSAYVDAIRDGLASHNPVEHVEIPKAPKKAAQFLRPEQATALNATIEGSELGLLLSFMLGTGTRVGEATGIRWQDVDFANRRIHVRGQLQRIDGKLAYRPTTKTNQDRVLPVSQAFVDRLRAMAAERMVSGETSDPDGIVFLNAEGRRLDNKYVSERLKALCVAAGVPPVSPHKLRHTAATLALAETGDLHQVQKLLGHQQVSLTSDLYGHATAETLRGATEAIERALSRKAS